MAVVGAAGPLRLQVLHGGKQNVRVVAGRSSRRDEIVQAIVRALGFRRVRERVFTTRLYKLQNFRWCLMTPTLYVTLYNYVNATMLTTTMGSSTPT